MTVVFIALEVAESKIELGVFGDSDEPCATLTIDNRHLGYNEALAWIADLGVPKNDLVIGAEGEGGYLSPFDEMLCDAGYRFIALPPARAAHHREGMGYSDKTDPIDMRVIASLLRQTWRTMGPAMATADGETRMLTAASRTMHRLTRDISRSITRMTSLLHQYWPELVRDAACPGLDTYGMLAVLQKWSSPQALRRASTASITVALKKASRGSKGAATTRLLKALASQVTFESSRTPALAIEVALLAAQIERLKRARTQLEKETAARMQVHSLGRKLMALPNVGIRTASAMLAGMQPADGIVSEPALARLLGVAPRRKQSGNSDYHCALPACRRDCKAALMLYAARLSQCDKESGAYVQRKRDEGKSYWRALKALSRHLVRRLWQILQQDRQERLVLRNAA